MVDSLLQVNRMLYKMPPSISIANSRHYQTGFPQQTAYTAGRTIVFDSQTGSAFIDGKTSYLKLRLTTDNLGDFGKGSAMSLVERVVVRSRQGKELSRLEGASIINNVNDRFTCPQGWFGTAGPAEGYPLQGDITAYNQGLGTSNFAGGVVFVLPVHKLCPCLNQDKLLPPQLMEGLRIEITLQTAADAFLGAVTNYTVDQIELKWDAYDIADQFKRAVMEMAASQGLNLVHKEWYRTIVAATATQYDFDIKKAASKALQVVTIPRLTSQLNDVGQDANKCETYDFSRQQYHIGSVYYPNSPLDTADQTAAGNKESFWWTLAAYRSLPCRMFQDVSPATYTSQFGVSSASLNKSQTSDIQGTIINNSRALLAELQFATSADRRLDSYLCHLRAVKVFPSNVVVRD
jgi:hypothetical protein